MPKTIKNYDNTTIGRYIRAIENPDSIGFDRKRRIWYDPQLDPRGGKSYDSRNRGMGVDVFNNEDAAAYTQGNPGRELTEEEERYFRNQHIQYSLDALRRQARERNIPYPSNFFLEAMAVGAIYRGDAGQLWDPSTSMGKALRDTGDDAEWNFRQALNEYNTSKGLHDRVKNSEEFLDSGTMQTQIVPEHVISKPVKKKSEGGNLNQPKKAWDDLSMSEKSEVMKLAIQSGVQDLDTIKGAYNEFASGGSIHIAPSKRGTFTAAATKHEMGVQEFASKVLANKDAYSPAMVKKANFARNASHWKHGLGGNLNTNQYGNTFDDGGLFGNETVDTVASFLPILGTVEDAYQFYKDPSLANAGWLALSLGSDIFTGGMASRAIKAARAANRAVDAANAANRTARTTWNAGRRANMNQSGSVNGADMRRMINAVKAAGATRNAAIRRANDALFDAGIKTAVDQGTNTFLNTIQLNMLPNFGLGQTY